jgi:26S proteasome regulatory subunit N7
LQLTGGGEKGALIPVKQYLEALYGCHYDEFFVILAQIESQRLKFDRYLAPHYHFYSRAMRLRAYQQFLTPYKTVSNHPILFYLRNREGSTPN